MFNHTQRQQLLAIAQQSIENGLQQGRASVVNVHAYDPLLQQHAASFVTLQKSGQLRGCIGTLEARQPLVKDVAQNAYAAAFRDPRFAPLDETEFALIDIHISVLSKSEKMHILSEQDLLSQLTPGKDGLILESGNHRGTFLPSVWEQLPEPKDFLKHLKIKAGMNADDWPDDIQVSRYFTEAFGRDDL